MHQNFLVIYVALILWMITEITHQCWYLLLLATSSSIIHDQNEVVEETKVTDVNIDILPSPGRQKRGYFCKFSVYLQFDPLLVD